MKLRHLYVVLMPNFPIRRCITDYTYTFSDRAWMGWVIGIGNQDNIFLLLQQQKNNCFTTAEKTTEKTTV